jgi:hypothetical protein
MEEIYIENCELDSIFFVKMSEIFRKCINKEN